ncbi:MAG: ComF family protein, partial [Chthoniobacterales bacterium]
MKGLVTQIPSLIETIRDLFYPPHCSICAKALTGRDLMCMACETALPRIVAPFCPVCSQPMLGLRGDSCVNCRERNYYLQCVVAPYQSKDAVRELVHRFKYGRQLHLRKLLGKLAFEGMQDSRIKNLTFDWIVPVPLHSLKEREREFNQAAEIGAILSRLSGVPMKNALKRVRYTPTQTRFDRITRMRNLQGAFKVSKNHTVPEKTILLVDDVVTTASTLDECARTFLDAGAHAVYGITVARG